MKLQVIQNDGTPLETFIELEQEVFGIEPNEHCMYLAIQAELANMRQGTHKGKTRGEVSGGGRKPWRQKGRGTSRAGSNRSPLWVSGGKVFPPRPHLYTQKLNKKVRRLARRSALSAMVKNECVVVVDEISIESPKTREFVELLNNLKLIKKKVTILVHDVSENLYLASRNVPNVTIVPAERASTYDILNCEVLLMEKRAAETLNTLLKA
ncbi:MAG: 50S ribosomal protein L4 [Candidatus Marinimicrobia bacterium]|nr:50S ribosomal protein L4 [Candidatus Neomarinimicrobiota bacterium]MDD5581863.1 50S ribosomal protein L4 [Candidatus Neomarinimicrobiota bacterium]